MSRSALRFFGRTAGFGPWIPHEGHPAAPLEGVVSDWPALLTAVACARSACPDGASRTRVALRTGLRQGGAGARSPVGGGAAFAPSDLSVSRNSAPPPGAASTAIVPPCVSAT